MGVSGASGGSPCLKYHVESDQNDLQVQDLLPTLSGLATLFENPHDSIIQCSPRATGGSYFEVNLVELRGDRLTLADYTPIVKADSNGVEHLITFTELRHMPAPEGVHPLYPVEIQ